MEQVQEQVGEQVRVCRVCGHLNPSIDSTRCVSCWSFLAGADLVPRAQVQRRSRIPSLHIWRRRYQYSLLAAVLALILWRVVVFLDPVPLVFAPSGATTSAGPATSPNAWAQSGNDFRNTGYTPAEAPFPEKVRWTFSSTNGLATSPVVVDGRVYLTTEDKRTLALDVRSGEMLWEYHSGWPSSSTPAVTGDLVISAVRPGIVVALDRITGEVKWENHTGSPILSSPVVADGTVYIGSADSNVHALDVATGETRWIFPTGAWVTKRPAYMDGTIAVASLSKELYIVGDRSARQQFFYDTGRGRQISGSPIFQGDYVYFGTQDGSVWALDRHAKSYPLERGILFWRVNLYIWGVLPPPVQNGTVWTNRVVGGMSVGIAVAPDMLYAGGLDGTVSAVDAESGEKIWGSDVGSHVTSTPTVAGNTVMVGTEDGRVVGLNRASGEIIWEFQTSGKVTASPVVAENTLFVASRDGRLYAVEAR